MLKTITIGFLFSMALMGVACSDDEGGANNGDASSAREEFIQDAEDRIADLRAELEELREGIANGDAGAEVEEQADALEGRISDAESGLEDVRAASDDEWEALKGSVDEALGDAGNLAEEIGSELGID